MMSFKKRNRRKILQHILCGVKRKKVTKERAQTESFDNKVYNAIIHLDAPVLPLHLPANREIKPHGLTSEEEKKSGLSRLLRRRTSSCPEFADRSKNVSGQYERVNSKVEDHEYVYVDASKFAKTIAEIKKHRSTSDLSRLKISHGTSLEKFRRSQTLLNTNVDISHDKFAAYVILDGTDAVYKMPSSVPKYDPPKIKPMEQTYIDMCPDSYRSKQTTITCDPDAHAECDISSSDACDSEYDIAQKFTCMTLVEGEKDVTTYEGLNDFEERTYERMLSDDVPSVDI